MPFLHSRNVKKIFPDKKIGFFHASIHLCSCGIENSASAACKQKISLCLFRCLTNSGQRRAKGRERGREGVRDSTPGISFPFHPALFLQSGASISK